MRLVDRTLLYCFSKIDQKLRSLYPNLERQSNRKVGTKRKFGSCKVMDLGPRSTSMKEAADSYNMNQEELHLRNSVYWKDLRYLSPGVRPSTLPDASAKGEGTQCKSLMKAWVDEVYKGVKQFFYEGSLHGVKYIFEPSFSRKERVTWILIVVFSMTLCVGNIMALFNQWATSPFVNVMDSLQTPVWAVPFPSVVLCPHLHVKMSYGNVTEMDELEYFFASLVCPKMAKLNKATKRQLTPSQNKKLQEFILKASPTCSEVVHGCFWRPINDQDWLVKECCDLLFQPVFTNYGVCYGFNRLPLNGMSNITINWQRTYDHKAYSRSLVWTLDEGYPKVLPPDPWLRPFRAMASGELNGLGIDLYLNTSEHQFACDGISLGYTVLIGSPTDHIYTSTVLRIPMGRWTTIEVSPVTYRTDPALRSLSSGRRQCFFQNERKLEYYSIYTDSNCKHDLLIREARKMCNCVLFNWPRKYISEPICSTEQDFRCINEVNGKVDEQLIYAYYDQNAHSSSAITSCYPSCNDILYTNQVYYSDWKVSAMDSTHDGKNDKLADLGQITRINVHFYDDLFIGLHRHAQYDGGYFAGAIGGLLSLFLGFSIISVAELIYFVILRPLHIIFACLFERKQKI